MLEKKIKKEIEKFEKAFGHCDNFKVWVDNINNGEKYIVRCSCRATFAGRRRTFKYQATVVA